MADKDLPSPPRDRYYGRIDGTFVTVCPACGTLLRGGYRRPAWNAATSELRCRCGAVWVVGLALWRARKGHRRPALPMDQVPDADALRQLRAEADAKAERKARAHQGGTVEAGPVEKVGGRVWRTNLAPECTCAYGEEPLQHVRVWVNPACARHGEADEV